MKTSLIMFASFLASASGQAGDRVVAVLPFHNLSGIQQHITYETSPGSPGNPRHQVSVDRYSHAPREILEDVIGKIPGIRLVERATFDRTMLDISGSIRDSLVDDEKAEKVGVALGADAIVLGTIVEMNEFVSEYNGYTYIKDTVYTVKLRVRFIDLTKKDKSGKIVPSITAAQEVNGKCTIPETRYLRLKNRDVYFSALKDALDRLSENPEFKRLFGAAARSDEPRDLVNVDFFPRLTNCTVYTAVEGGWKYLGETPFKTRLRAGIQYRIRVEKIGFVPWETIIEPDEGLKINHELLRKPDGAGNDFPHSGQENEFGGKTTAPSGKETER